MSLFEDKLKKLAVDLYNIDAVKFGSFVTKVGITTPVYFDFRVIISFPKILEDISYLLMEAMITDLKYDHVCGVPYTALPIATVISIKKNIPMLMRRKESKGYGTKKMIEGSFSNGSKCLIIEDVVTSGSSILETVNDLRSEGLDVTDAVIILNREQGGIRMLQEKGINVKSLYTITSFVNMLSNENKIENSVAEEVRKYIKENQIVIKGVKELPNRLTIPFSERAKLCENLVGKRLLELMSTKKTNLCVAADLTTSQEVLSLAEEVGSLICILKLHIDILEDFSENFINSLKLLASKHNFLLMEDRKYADIGNTVALQYSKGPFRTVEWADLVTAHSLPGDGVLKGIQSVIQDQPRGVFLLAQMSSEGNLITPQYIEETNKQAEKYHNLVVGLVCQSKETIKHPHLIQFTPGVQIDNIGDDLGQTYNSPSNVILAKGADIAVVGRGITKSPNPKEEASIFRNLLWKHYEERVNTSK